MTEYKEESSKAKGTPVEIILEIISTQRAHIKELTSIINKISNIVSDLSDQISSLNKKIITLQNRIDQIDYGDEWRFM